jgi:SAM-dependent methyltransferase
MWTKLTDIYQMLKVAELGNILKLKRASRALRTSMRPYLIMESLIALEKLGLLRELSRPEGVDVQKLDTLDRHYLQMTLDYLFSVGVLETTPANGFVFNGDGSSLVAAVYTSMAYHEPVRELDKLIEQKIKYGADTIRDNYYDAVATEFFTSLFLYPFVADILRANHVKSVCDLGCGTGGFPSFLGDSGKFFELYGLDLSANAIAEGISKGHSRKARLFASDILEPETWVKEIARELDAFSIMLVLHEFEDQDVLSILKGLRSTFGRTRIVLTELVPMTPQEARRIRSIPRAEVDFIHSLSLQKIRPESDWRDLFEGSGYRLENTVRHDLSSTQVLVFEPLNA